MSSLLTLFFPRAGYISTDDRYSYQGIGDGGYAWSSAIENTTRAYTLHFYDDSVSPSDFFPRFYGHPVRCLVS